MISGDITALRSPLRTIKAKVELYEGSTLVDTFLYTDALKEIDIERIGNEGKFFGFVICQKATIKLVDKDRAINITDANSFKIYFASGDGEYTKTHPTFYVDEVARDENTNELTITAYDALAEAINYTVDDVNFVGKNLFTDENIVWNIGSVSYADGIYTLSQTGTASYKAAYFMIPNGRDLVGETVAISGWEKNSGVNSAGMRLCWANVSTGGGGTQVCSTEVYQGPGLPDWTYRSKSGTVPEAPGDAYELCLLLYSNSSGQGLVAEETYTSWYKDVQIELGSVATDYEPYISSKDEINLTTALNCCAKTLPNISGIKLVGNYTNDLPNAFGMGNFEGTETLQSVFTDAAEVTGTIMYISPEDKLVIKGIANAAADLQITKADYITLKSETNRKLTTIISATELGDNISATTGEEGSTQYIRDNDFIDLRDDRATILNLLIDLVGGLTLNQFDCSWRGNYLLEIGDKIQLVTKDDSSVYGYVINDKLVYAGGLKGETSWNYQENEGETASNPATIGEAIKQTFAKVDKVNKEISIVASEASENTSEIAALKLNTSSINATVSRIEEETKDSLENANAEISSLKASVSAQLTPEAVEIQIQRELAEGVNKVTTTTGFTFDETGLTIDKTGSEIKTTITEDGMKVFKNDEAVLTADNTGVNARNLHATTYLIIGNNSRFEDYGENRTGCFWIGGNS